MIRNENEYRASVEKLTGHEERLAQQKVSLKEEGLTPSQIKRGMDPLISFTEQLREEIAYYEHLKQGNVPDIEGFSTIGHVLIALRIAQNVTQKELASALGTDPSQVCRDEKNEYHGITIERAERVLQALGGEALIQIQTSPSKRIPSQSVKARKKSFA
jgi:hypothetical protein